jgi:hypothetical protein
MFEREHEQPQNTLTTHGFRQIGIGITEKKRKLGTAGNHPEQTTSLIVNGLKTSLIQSVLFFIF